MKLKIFLLIALIAVVCVHAQPPRPQGSGDSDSGSGGGGGSGDSDGSGSGSGGGGRRNCPGEPRQPNQNCREPRDDGTRRGGRDCRDRSATMWYFNRRSQRCQPMDYLGCGGNGNRFCSRRDCERRCDRRGGRDDD